MICPYGLDRPGGVQGQVLGLARSLAAGGVEVLVLAPGTRVSVAGVDVVSVGATVDVRANGSVAPLALGPGAWIRTVGTLRRWQPDVVHLHEPLAPGPTWAGLLAPLGRTARIGTLHRAGGALVYRLAGPVGRAGLGRLDALVAVSEEARRTAVVAIGDRPCPIMANGVELGRFAAAGAEPTDGPTVLFVGRHEPRKGLAVLLQAVDRLGPAWPGRLWIVGDGPQTAELRHRYPSDSHRRWWGAVDDSTLARLLVGSHIVCAPSLGGESFGVVLLEAMATGNVVVCSAIPGYQSVLGNHGVTVAPGDVGALAGALDDAVSSVASKRGPAAPGALRDAADHARTFSMDVLAQRYRQVYERLSYTA